MKDERTLKKELEEFVPINKQEEADKKLILKCLSEGDQIFFRENEEAHLSASGWVVNQTMDRVLMAYHNIYHSWAWTGGHADGVKDLLSVAMREAREETGIKTVTPVMDQIFSLEVLTVDGHEKKGVYVPSHLHLNVTYLLKGDDREEIRNKVDENSKVGWFSLNDCLEAVNEPWMKERIYKKLIEKMENLKI
ncbi:MAG: NUDIX domain-containing protein [Paenibacillaceae bacterium]|nr:NUDIX domain-containing protein [Paenibacillaceae bacterium]